MILLFHYQNLECFLGLTYLSKNDFNIQFFVSSIFIIIPACSSLSTKKRNSIYDSRNDVGSDVFFSTSVFLNRDVKVIIRMSVNFVIL